MHWAPGIPRALFDEGDEIFRQTSGAMRGENTDACPCVIANQAPCLARSVVMPAKAGIQYAVASRSITAVSGILDHPLSRMMTAECAARSVVMPAKAGIQYAAASRLIIGVSGILDHPLELVIGRADGATRWRMMTAECAARSVVMPAKAGIQYAAASRLIIGVSGILDHPLELVIGRAVGAIRWRMMTAVCAARTCRYRRTLKNSFSKLADSVSPTAEYTSGT